MLIIPTSLNTAIILEIRHPLIWSAVLFASVACGAYCLWEMLLSSLIGRRPAVSRWRWLAVAALLLAVAVLCSGLMFGPVTFNANADWLMTSWGFVLGGWLMAAFVACAAVLLVLRGLDSMKAGAPGPLPHIAWWLLGVVAMIAYGLLLAWNEDGTGGPVVGTAVRLASLALTTAGLGSLLAVAVIRGLRAQERVTRAAAHGGEGGAGLED